MRHVRRGPVVRTQLQRDVRFEQTARICCQLPMTRCCTKAARTGSIVSKCTREVSASNMRWACAYRACVVSHARSCRVRAFSHTAVSQFQELTPSGLVEGKTSDASVCASDGGPHTAYTKNMLSNAARRAFN